MMNDKRSIGIFDSGFGGLTVLSAIKKLLPNENIVYFGDTARVPYGNKSKRLIQDYSLQISSFLLGKNVKLIVIGCNSATALALDLLRKTFSIPIIGVIKAGAKNAIKKSLNHNIGIIGTVATIKSRVYENEIKMINSKVNIYSKACPLFVPLVENGWFSGDVVEKIIKHYLDPLIEREIDTLVLGCTHYPLLKKAISDQYNVKLIDSAESIAREANLILEKNNIKKTDTIEGEVIFYVTDSPEKFEKTGSLFFTQKIKNIHLINEY